MPWFWQSFLYGVMRIRPFGLPRAKDKSRCTYQTSIMGFAASVIWYLDQ